MAIPPRCHAAGKPGCPAASDYIPAGLPGTLGRPVIREVAAPGVCRRRGEARPFAAFAQDGPFAEF